MDFPRSVPKAPVFCFIGFHVAHAARVGTCAGVKAVAWSPDGRKLATGGARSSAEGGVMSPQWQWISGFGDVKQHSFSMF
jgi:hypothetical protein